MAKTAEEAFTLLEDMASNNYLWPSKRAMMKRAAGIHEVDQLTTLSAHILAISNQFVALTTQGAWTLDTVAITNTSYTTGETYLYQAYDVNNKNFGFRGNQLPNHYRPGLRNMRIFHMGIT